MPTSSRSFRDFKRATRFCPTRPAAPVITIFRIVALEIHLVEDRRWNHTNDRHDQTPARRRVNHVAAAVGGFSHYGSHGLRGGPERSPLGHSSRHRRIGRPRFGDDRPWTGPAEAMTYALYQNRHAGLGRSVDIVGASSAIASDRS